jgi:hypothetical protein
MAKLNDSELKNILSKLLMKSLSNSEPAKEIVEQAMNDDDFKEQVTLLCEAYIKPEFRESKLVANSVDVRALPSLVDICKREQIGIIPIDFSGEDDRVYNKNDKISVLVLSSQLQDFNKNLLEANAVSGAALEMNRKTAEIFAKNLKDSNPMLEIRGIKKKTYEAMKNNMGKLPYEMRFTLFPDQVEKNKLNIGFFTKTQPIIINRGHLKEMEGPYAIPKIASVLLASALLEKPDLEKKYEKIKKRNLELMQDIYDMYYDSEEPYYLVPATVGKDVYNVFMDQAYYVDYYDKSIDVNIVDSFINSRFNGLNHTIIPMTMNEFEQYKNEIVVSPQEINFYSDRPTPIFAEPEKMIDKDLSETLIDMLNRKREQLMLLSDDFNGQNLTSLEDYIVGSVHEMIVREDEDYSQWLQMDEKMDTREMELLSELEESYSMVAVYESHDKVSELINNERAGLESFPEIGDSHEDISL